MPLRLGLFAFLFAAAPQLAAAQAQSKPEFEPPQIVSVKGYQFDEDTGVFSSSDVLSDDFSGGWNPKGRDALLIVVELKGPPERVYNGMLGPGSKYSVRVVATEQNPTKTLLNRTRVIRSLNADGRLFVSFVIEPSFCRAVRITARIVGRSVQPLTERMAGFACGE